MVRKHTIKKEKKTNYVAKTGDITITETEEHVIIEKHEFMVGDDAEDEDLMFIGKKSSSPDSDEEAEPALIIFNDDDKFW